MKPHTNMVPWLTLKQEDRVKYNDIERLNDLRDSRRMTKIEKDSEMILQDCLRPTRFKEIDFNSFQKSRIEPLSQYKNDMTCVEPIQTNKGSERGFHPSLRVMPDNVDVIRGKVRIENHGNYNIGSFVKKGQQTKPSNFEVNKPQLYYEDKEQINTGGVYNFQYEQPNFEVRKTRFQNESKEIVGAPYQLKRGGAQGKFRESERQDNTEIRHMKNEEFLVKKYNESYPDTPLNTNRDETSSFFQGAPHVSTHTIENQNNWNMKTTARELTSENKNIEGNIYKDIGSINYNINDNNPLKTTMRELTGDNPVSNVTNNVYHSQVQTKTKLEPTNRELTTTEHNGHAQIVNNKHKVVYAPQHIDRTLREFTENNSYMPQMVSSVQNVNRIDGEQEISTTHRSYLSQPVIGSFHGGATEYKQQIMNETAPRTTLREIQSTSVQGNASRTISDFGHRNNKTISKTNRMVTGVNNNINVGSDNKLGSVVNSNFKSMRQRDDNNINRQGNSYKNNSSIVYSSFTSKNNSINKRDLISNRSNNLQQSHTFFGR